jgi:hypothetical protein
MKRGVPRLKTDGTVGGYDRVSGSTLVKCDIAGQRPPVGLALVTLQQFLDQTLRGHKVAALVALECQSSQISGGGMRHG